MFIKICLKLTTITIRLITKFYGLRLCRLRFLFLYGDFFNPISSKENLARRRLLAMNDQRCVVNCGVDEDIDHFW